MRSLLRSVETPLQITAPILFQFCSTIMSLDVSDLAEQIQRLGVQERPSSDCLFHFQCLVLKSPHASFGASRRCSSFPSKSDQSRDHSGTKAKTLSPMDSVRDLPAALVEAGSYGAGVDRTGTIQEPSHLTERVMRESFDRCDPSCS